MYPLHATEALPSTKEAHKHIQFLFDSLQKSLPKNITSFEVVPVMPNGMYLASLLVNTDFYGLDNKVVDKTVGAWWIDQGRYGHIVLESDTDSPWVLTLDGNLGKSAFDRMLEARSELTTKYPWIVLSMGQLVGVKKKDIPKDIKVFCVPSTKSSKKHGD